MASIRIESGERCEWVRIELGKANAVGPEFLAAMDATLDRLTAGGEPPGSALDAAARPVLFTGEGSAFSAGLDLPVLLGLDRPGMTSFLIHFDRVFRRLATLPRPTLAVINGHAVAGGTVLALACDLRIAATTTPKGTPYFVGLKEAALGLPLPSVVAEIVAAAIPPGSARNEIVFTGHLYGPEEARQRGLVDLLAAAPDLESAALRAAEPYANATGRAIARLKRQFRAELHEGFERPRDDTPFLDAWFSAETRRRIQTVIDGLRR